MSLNRLVAQVFKNVRRMIGKESKMLSSNELLPKGERLVVGENTAL